MTTKSPSERIEARLAERKQQLERDIPGIGDFIDLCKSVFGPVWVKPAEYGIPVSPVPMNEIVRGRKGAKRRT